MGARGPLPTPTKILEARGSWLVNQREGEVQFERATPACPSFLSKEAKAEWRRQVKQLDAAGVLQLVDRAALAVYCDAWARFVLASQQLDARGGDLDAAETLVRIQAAAASKVLKAAEHFGFSPAARARVRAPQRKAEEPQGGKARFFAG